MVPISAMVGANDKENSHFNINKLIETLHNTIDVPTRNIQGPFFYLIDHCFLIKGQGSVVTGTVIQG
jgi:selenocysteine-specific elongation factor